MSQSKLAKLLKIIIVVIGIMGLAIYCYVIPLKGRELSTGYMSGWYFTGIIFTMLTAVPVYAGLVIFWRVCSDIQKDRSFTYVNAERMKVISFLALADSVYHFTGNIVLFALNMNRSSHLLFSVFIDGVGLTVAIAAAVLAHLVTKAAKLKEDSDLTI